MADLNVNSIGDASGGNTATINGYAPTLSNMAGRNLIINGDMRIAQRGTSATGIGLGDDSTYNTVDRWVWRYSGSITSEYTESQSTDSPDDFSFSRKFECTTAGSGHNYIETHQGIEAQNVANLNYGSSAAKTLTLSFWVKCSQTGTGSVFVYTTDSVRSFTANYTISAANTWEYKTITIVGDTSGTGIPSDNGEGLRISFGLSATSSYTSGTADTWATYSNDNRHAGLTLDISSGVGEYLAFTGVQLEAGSVATPFEHLDYSEMLSRCQRYYQEGFSFWDGGSTYMREPYYFRPRMRATPTVYVYAKATTGSGTGTVNKIYQGGGETAASADNADSGVVRISSYGFTANVDVYYQVKASAEL